EDLLAIADGFDPERVGFCLDTQHAFGAGILDRDHITNFAGFSTPDFIDRLEAIHFNDSLVPSGAHKDRHALIGQGEIGPAPLAQILTDPRLAHIPFYLETPVATEAQFADEIRRSWELYHQGQNTATLPVS
ncbi:MAG: TIM barrel protein, partial [Firmicutes bacterium]|nr:TIM barrel protein [Bacillota bacterium]